LADCCICGKVLRGSAWVCICCERTYCLPKAFAEWPEWARVLKNCEHEERRYWQREAGQYTEAGDCPDDDPDCLPDSPYDNEDDNIAYRKANRVTHG